MVKQLLREEGEDGAEERFCDELGCECCASVVFAKVGREEVAGEGGRVRIYAVAEEDDRCRGSGPGDGVYGRAVGDRPCEPPQCYR